MEARRDGDGGAGGEGELDVDLVEVGRKHGPIIFLDLDLSTSLSSFYAAATGGVPAATALAAARPAAGVGELLAQCDDSTWSVRCDGFRELRRFCRPESAMEVLPAREVVRSGQGSILPSSQ